MREAMNQNKSIKKNMLMSMILTVSNFIFPLITYSYVARVLTPVGVGKVSFVQSVLQYFSYFATLGIPTYGLRECAKVRDDKQKLAHVVQELFLINIIATIVAYILLIVLVFTVPKLYTYNKLFFVMSLSIILNTIGFEWLYQALEDYSYITIRSLILKCISVLLTFILIKNENDYIWYGFLTVFTTSASYIFNFINLHRIINIKFTGDYHLKRHLKPIFTLFSASIIITIYANFDVSMLGFISTEKEVGLYSSALKIKSILLSFSTAVTSVIVPRMAYYMKSEDKIKSYNLAVKSLRVSTLLAVPLAIYVFIFSKDALIFVCGYDYISASKTLKILMLCILPLILTNLFGNQILIPLGNEKRYSQSVFVGMWINLILNILLIPSLGSFGAALGTLATEIWNVVWMGSGVKDYVDYIRQEFRFHQYFLSLILGIFISCFTYYYVQQLNVFLQLCCTAIAFFVCYYGTLYWFKEPLLTEQLNKVIAKIKLIQNNAK
jgi:O-antigen/teichoic acid export membrane protein